MLDFAPPVGPPPPKVPEGWKAIWNDQYNEYFYVNTYTKISQWDKPTSPVYPPGEAPHAQNPSYDAPPPSDTSSTFGTNNPYATAPPNQSEDERLARQLQAEEEERVRGHNTINNGNGNGTAGSYYSQGQAQAQPQTQTQLPSYGPQPAQYAYGQATNAYPAPSSPGKKSKGGIVGKLLGKVAGASQSHSRPHQPGYGYGHAGGPVYPPHGYNSHRPIYGGGGMGRKPGMGMGGAAALGAGGGLVGGAMLGSALSDNDGDTYVQNNYGDDFEGGGGDFGGGDFGGGDFGGGDFGGGE